MPIVRVDFWEGAGEEKVKAMIRGITNVMMDLGVPFRATMSLKLAPGGTVISA